MQNAERADEMVFLRIRMHRNRVNFTAMIVVPDF